MRPDQVLLTILAIVVLANVLVVALIPLRTFTLRRSPPEEPVQPPRVQQPQVQQERFQPDRPAAPATSIAPAMPAAQVARPTTDESRRPGPGRPATGQARDDEDARAAAAIEAFVAEVSADAEGRTRVPGPAAAIPFRTVDRPEADDREPSALPLPERQARGPEPAPAGLADPATWARALREESARVARFGRPVTVVMAELPQLDGVADRLGRDAADQVVSETARLLVTEGRAADRVAWLGGARFGVLLLETEEVRARGYIDRVRAAADGWLESAGLSVRLSLGWASPSDGGDVLTAAASAQQRMRAVDRHLPPGAAPQFGA
jgi:diguanylate cyclase (GGDEF)-like protein